MCHAIHWLCTCFLINVFHCTFVIMPDDLSVIYSCMCDNEKSRDIVKKYVYDPSVEKNIICYVFYTCTHVLFIYT